MAILDGSASITRFRVTALPEEPDFDRAAFREIPPGSELRESIGFLPFEPEAPYQVGNRRFAFRVRIDKITPDPTAVRERVKEMVRIEMETSGLPFVGSKKRKKLRELAEEEILATSSPRSRIIEGVVDSAVLYVGTTAKTYLGSVVLLLRKVGILAELATPWQEGDEGDAALAFIEAHEPGQSVLGCRFLESLLDDGEILFEPESGSVRLQTHETKVNLSGAVLNDVHRYLERGAGLLSAKLVAPDASFRLDALTFRVSGLKVETGRHDHWTELLDERLERISGVFEMLDRKYQAHRGRGPVPQGTAKPVSGEPAPAEKPN